MKALILAGGLGTRLRPLTYSRPKPLLPIANRPHMAHVFDLLRRNDIDQAVLLTSYLASEFDVVAEDASRAGMEIEVAQETEPLGTAGALKNAAGMVGDDTFVVFNGDVLTGADISKLIAFHRDRAAHATILLTPVDDPSDYGVVPTDEEGRIIEFVEKPPRDSTPTNLINAGVYVMSPQVLDRIPENEVWSAERQLFPEMVERRDPFFALALDGYWIDVGTPEKYVQANLDAISGALSTELSGTLKPNDVLVAEGAEIHGSARVSSACLGTGASISENAQVERSVLFAGASVGRGAHVVGAILGEGARVTEGADLRGVAVGDREVVGER